MLALGAVAAAGAPATLAAAGPQLGKTALATPTGRVFLKAPGATQGRLTSARLIPIGSILETAGRHGSVRIISATNASGASQSATFQGGPFQIEQPADEHGTINIHLVDGKMRCGTGASGTQASAARAQDRGGASTHVNADAGRGSRVVVTGGHASGRPRGKEIRFATVASVQTTRWTTVDSCHGATATTTIIDNFGEVATTARNAAVQKIPISFNLEAAQKQTVAYSCGGGSVPYCAAVLSSDPTKPFDGKLVQMPTFQLTFVTRNETASNYELEISPPDGTSTTTYYPLPKAGSNGYRESQVNCFPDDDKGEYDILWRLNHVVVADIIYQAPAQSPTESSCTSTPFTAAVPAAVSQNTLSVGGHFRVYYTTAPGADAVPSAQDAIDVGDLAEKALTYYANVLGMPLWKSPITGPLNIYIEASTLPFDSDTQTVPEPLPGQSALPPEGQPTPAYITLFPRSYDDPYIVGFAVFWALRDEGIGNITPVERASLPYGTAVWAANNFVSSLGESSSHYEANYAPALGQPLDCNLTCPDDDPPYDKWRFFQYLAEHYGPTVVEQILEDDAKDIQQEPAPTAGQMDEALQAALLPYDVTVANALSGYVLEDLTDSWAEKWVGGTGLSVGNPATAVTTLQPGQNLPEQTFDVQDLAAQYLKVVIPATGHPCVSETLTLSIVVPLGGSVPGASVYIGSKASQVPSLQSPGSATEAVTVSSCTGATVRLPFVNGTVNPAPLTFSVSGNLS